MKVAFGAVGTFTVFDVFVFPSALWTDDGFSIYDHKTGNCPTFSFVLLGISIENVNPASKIIYPYYLLSLVHGFFISFYRILYGNFGNLPS